MARPKRLALDLGTTSVKAALFGDAGRRLETRRIRLSLRHLEDGGVEQDPEEIVDAARVLLSRTARSIAVSDSPIPCGIACQRSTVILWERSSGRAVGPAVSWLDRRAARLEHRWESGRTMLARRTGLRLSPHYGAAHLARLFLEDRALARAAMRGTIVAGPVASYVLVRLEPGTPPACDPTLAQRTLLYDPRRRCWDPELLELFGIPESCLPSVRPSTGRWADLSAGKRAIEVTALAGDQQAAAAAFDLGGREACAIVHLGTGAFALWPAPRALPPGSGTLLHSVRADAPSRFFVEGPVNSAGTALDAVGRWIGSRRLRIALSRAARRSLGPDDPLLVPAFAGLAAPHWDAAAWPVLAGMSPSDGPDQIVRAALAGLAHRIGDIFEAGARTLPRSGAVVLSGPLAGIPGFAGFFADVLARPVRIAREPEATLRGIARLAGRGVSGRHSPAESPIPGAAVGPITEPRLSRNDRDACRARWRRALRASRSSPLPRS